MEKYTNYFQKASETWSLVDFNSYVIENFEVYNVKTTERVFHNHLNEIPLRKSSSRDINEKAKNLSKPKQADIKIANLFWKDQPILRGIYQDPNKSNTSKKLEYTKESNEYKKGKKPQYVNLDSKASNLAFNPQLILKLVNDERKKVGAPPLALDSKLMKAAQKHTDFMVSIDTLTHNDPVGSLGERVKAEGYNFSNVGENIAQGFRINEEVRVMKAWMKSSGHRANILDKAFTNLGVGFGGGKYWTQVFGRPLDNKKIKMSWYI